MAGEAMGVPAFDDPRVTWLLVSILGLVVEAIVIVALARGVTGSYEPPTAEHRSATGHRDPPATTPAGTVLGSHVS
jgi:hypothetical protein